MPLIGHLLKEGWKGLTREGSTCKEKQSGNGSIAFLHQAARWGHVPSPSRFFFVPHALSSARQQPILPRLLHSGAFSRHGEGQ